jgi:hypothetical protein
MSKRVKQYLMLLAALGIVAVALGGGSGTFASFNAEVANTGNIFATGTLFLHNHPVGKTVCRSEDSTDGTNVNLHCDVPIYKLNAVPGDDLEAQIAITNAGNINANSLTLAAKNCIGGKPTIATASSYASGGTTVALTYSGLGQTLVSGTKLLLTNADGSTTYDTVTVNSNVSAASGTLNVTSDSGPLNGSSTNPVYIRIDSNFGGVDLCQATSNGAQFYVYEGDGSGTFTQGSDSCSWPVAASSPCSYGATGTSTLGQFATTTGTTPLALGAINGGQERDFTVGIKIPASSDNSEQNSAAQFDLDWNAAQ